MARLLPTAVALAGTAAALPAFAQQAEHQLDNIVVTAAGFEQALTSAPASISVVTREDLESRPVASVAEAVARVPGVDVRSGTGKTGSLNISIRGMPSDYTLILIDGRRQNSTGSVTPNGFGNTSTGFLPPVAAIERIEVIRGPMSTLYGSDAMGGVVNIITRKVNTDWSGTVTLDNTFQQDRDAGNDTTLSLYTAGPLVPDTLGLQLRGRLYDRAASERMIEGGAGRDPRPVEARHYVIGGRLNLTPDEANELWLDAERNHQVYSNDDNRLGTQDGTNRDGTPNPDRFNGYKDELRFQRDQIAVGHTGHYAIGTLDSSLTHKTTETLGRTLPTGSNPEYGYYAEGGEHRELENRDIVLDSKFVAPIGPHMLSVGGQYIDAELTDGAAGRDTFEQSSWALFLEDEWWLNDALALTLGGRYEHHDAFGGQFSPRGYLAWNATDQWTLKGGVGQGYKTPTLNQLHDGITGFSGQGTIVLVGSPDLQPEESTNYELGAYFDNQQGLNASATLFFNKFDEKIARQSAYNCNYDGSGDEPAFSTPPEGCFDLAGFNNQYEVGQQVNLDKAETQGIELSTRYRFAPDWTIEAGYTYTDTEITSGDSAGLALTNTPEHKLNASLTWTVNEQLSTTLEGEYYGDRERFPGGTPEQGDRNFALYDQVGNTLDGYALLHLGATYRTLGNLRITGTVRNLLDKDFSDATAYDDNGTTRYAYRYTQTGRSTNGVALDSRSLWLSLGYEF